MKTFILFFILASFNHLFAGITLTSTETIVATKETVTNIMFIGKDKIRIDHKSKHLNQTIIYRKDKTLTWTLDNTKKIYTEITDSQALKMIDQMKVMIENQKKSMLDQIELLPPEKKKEALHELKKDMPHLFGHITPTYKIKKPRKFGKWTCTEYDGFTGSTKTEEQCAVPLKELKVSVSQFSAMISFFQRLKFSQKGGLGAQLEEQIQQRGLPVLTKKFNGDRIISVSKLKNIKIEEYKNDLFQIPKGFSKIVTPGI